MRNGRPHRHKGPPVCSERYIIFFIRYRGVSADQNKSTVRQNDESPETLVVSGPFGYGARYRTRTCDPMHVKHVLYQLS